MISFGILNIVTFELSQGAARALNSISNVLVVYIFITPQLTDRTDTCVQNTGKDTMYNKENCNIYTEEITSDLLHEII